MEYGVTKITFNFLLKKITHICLGQGKGKDYQFLL